MSSHASHMTTEGIYGQMPALQLTNGDEHQPLNMDTTRLNYQDEPLPLPFVLGTAGQSIFLAHEPSPTSQVSLELRKSTLEG